MSTEDNKALIARFLREIFDERNVAIVDELVDPYHSLLSPETGTEAVEGTGVIKSAIEDYHSTGSGAGCTILNQISEGDWVATSFTLGDEQAEHMGILTSRLEDGRIRESYIVARDVSSSEEDWSARKIIN